MPLPLISGHKSLPLKRPAPNESTSFTGEDTLAILKTTPTRTSIFIPSSFFFFISFSFFLKVLRKLFSFSIDFPESLPILLYRARLGRVWPIQTSESVVGGKPLTQEEPVPPVCSRLEKWLHSRRLNPFCGPSSTLSKILDTPSARFEAIHDIDFSASDLKTLERTDRSNLLLHTIKTEEKKTSIENGSHLQTNEKMLSAPSGKGSEDIEAAVKKLSLVSTSSSMDDDQINPFSVLLSICGQSAPSVLQDIFSRYWIVPYFQVTCYLSL